MAIKNTEITTNIQSIFEIPEKFNIDDPDIIKAITTMIFCNKSIYNPANSTANTDILTVYAVPSENAAEFLLNPMNYVIINRLEIPAGETFTFDAERLTLSNGDSIKAVCTSNKLICTVSSVDLT